MTIQTMMELLDKWEKRLIAIGRHDNQQCHGLWLKLFPDGSGSVMADYADDFAGEEGTEDRAIRLVMTLAATPILDFDTIDELHGGLVAQTMSAKPKDGASP